MPRKRPRELPVPQEWQRRTITLIAGRAEVERVCAEWRAEGWQVMTIDTAPPTPAGHEAHVVRVAVPPPGWKSNEALLGDL